MQTHVVRVDIGAGSTSLSHLVARGLGHAGRVADVTVGGRSVASCVYVARDSSADVVLAPRGAGDVVLRDGWIVDENVGPIVELSRLGYPYGPARTCAVPRLLGAAATLRYLDVAPRLIAEAFASFEPRTHDGSSGTAWRVRGFTVWLERDLAPCVGALARKRELGRTLVLGAVGDPSLAAHVARTFDRVFAVPSNALCAALGERTRVVLGLDDAALVREALETSWPGQTVVVVSHDLEPALDEVVEHGGTCIAETSLESRQLARREAFDVACRGYRT